MKNSRINQMYHIRYTINKLYYNICTFILKIIMQIEIITSLYIHVIHVLVDVLPLIYYKISLINDTPLFIIKFKY